MRAGRACTGYALIAFDGHEGAQCVVECTSINDIKMAIANNSIMMQAACLAVGERLAQVMAREISMEDAAKGIMKNMFRI